MRTSGPWVVQHPSSWEAAMMASPNQAMRRGTTGRLPCRGDGRVPPGVEVGEELSPLLARRLPTLLGDHLELVQLHEVLHHEVEQREAACDEQSEVHGQRPPWMVRSRLARLTWAVCTARIWAWRRPEPSSGNRQIGVAASRAASRATIARRTRSRVSSSSAWPCGDRRKVAASSMVEVPAAAAR